MKRLRQIQMGLLVATMATGLVMAGKHLLKPLEHWSEAGEVIALERFFPDIFGPAVPIVRLRLESGQLVVAPLPNDIVLQPGRSVNLVASRSRLGRTEYRVCQANPVQLPGSPG